MTIVVVCGRGDSEQPEAESATIGADAAEARGQHRGLDTVAIGGAEA